MWQQLLLKLTQNVLYKKVKAWIVEAGFANILYLGISLGVWVIPVIPAIIKSHISVGALSIFVYINWNVIRKLIFKKEEVEEEVKEEVEEEVVVKAIRKPARRKPRRKKN